MADRSSSIPSRWRQALTILGAPVVKLALEADQPRALVAVRLNDLRPDGSDLRVTYGVLNLTHRDGHEKPVPLEPGRPVSGARSDERNRPRLSGRPSHSAGDLDRLLADRSGPRRGRSGFVVHTGDSRLFLPVRARQAKRRTHSFRASGRRPRTPRTVLQGPRQERTITRDVTTNEVVYTVVRDEGRSVIDEIGVETGSEKKVVYRIRPDDPTSARVDLREAFLHRHRHGWDTFVEAQCGAELDAKRVPRRSLAQGL